MIQVDGLCKWYGSKLAVDNVSFQVGRGEVLAFIGPNGAGKSTTMRIITGFIPASKGKVIVDGFEMETQPLQAKAKLGYLPENAPLYVNMTVSGFLGFAAEIRGYSGPEKRKRVDSVIERCFLERVRNQSIDTLSKGYKHRTCFAQAIIHDPDFLILDEPTDGLDPNQKREVRNLIKNMGQSKAIIISTHILEEVEAVASRVVLIDRGGKVFDGPPSELRSQADDAGSIKLEVCGKDGVQIREKIKLLDEVRDADLVGNGSSSVVVKITPNDSVDQTVFRKSVFNLAKKEDWDVADFEVAKGRLDNVFNKLTLSDDEEVKKS